MTRFKHIAFAAAFTLASLTGIAASEEEVEADDVDILQSLLALPLSGNLLSLLHA